MARRPVSGLLVISGILAALLASAGCETCPRERSMSAWPGDTHAAPAMDVEIVTTEYAAPRAAQDETVATAEATEQPAEDAAKAEADETAQKEKERAEKQNKREKEARDRERRRVKFNSDLELARLRIKRAEVGREQAMIAAREALDTAKFELDTARRRLETLKTREIPARVERAELNMQYAEDNLLEAQQELEQLTLMYAEEQIADKAREIVLDRAKRRIERSQQSITIQRNELVTMKEQQIPVELSERERDMVSKQQTLEKAERSLHTTELDQEIGLFTARQEIERLELELVKLSEEEAEAAETIAKEEAE